MRKWLVIMTLLLCATAGHAQLRRYDTDFTVSARGFSCTIPIEVERSQVYLSIEIGGHTYRFKLDTGASQGAVYDDVPISGLRPLGVISSEDATGRSQQVETVELPPFNLGPITISGFKVQRIHRNVVRQREDGIIGFALFHKGLAGKIDTRERLLRLTDRRDLFREAQGEALRYQLRKHVPYVRISPFEGLTEEVLFDSGSPLLYAANTQSFRQMKNQHPIIAQQIEGTTYGSNAIGHFGTETASLITLLAIDRLKWGSFSFRDVHATTVNGGSHVGAKLLDYGSLIIEPFRRRLIFQPYDNDVNHATIVGNRQHDIVIVERSGKAAVGMLLEHGRARSAGFVSGATIERVNGEPISFTDFMNYRWIIDQQYDFTLRLNAGIQITVRALWPLQYNKE